MRPVPARSRGAGFTLLEVLISISIFALVVSSVYGAYRATFQTVSSAERQAVSAAAARVILERFSEDLETIATDKDSYLLGQQGDIGDNRADGLSCISFAHLAFNRKERSSGRTVLTYSVVETEDGAIDLYRSDTPAIPGADGAETDKGLLLGRGLREFRITYVDANGNESEAWDSGSEAQEGGEAKITLPALVRLRIRLADSDEEGSGVVFRTAVPLPALPAGGTGG